MKTTTAVIQFADIGPDDPRLAADILPVLRELRPHLTSGSLNVIYAEGHPQGLRFTGAYVNNACLGVAGWRIVATTFCGRKLTIDDLVVGDAARSQGVGRALLAELQQRARAATATCWTLILRRTAPTPIASTCENTCQSARSISSSRCDGSTRPTTRPGTEEHQDCL